MSPGMPQAASEISDQVGHVMNYGDGWYGGYSSPIFIRLRLLQMTSHS